jgi:hypothetical protein
MELPITEVNICILKGQTFNQTLFWETGEPLTPVNLAGYTGKMEIKTHLNSPENILILTTTNGRMVLNEQTGSIRLTLSANETDSVNVDEGVHRVYLTNNGVATRIFQGKVYFNT